MLVAAAGQAAEQAVPFAVRAEGSFPLQYVESATSNSRQHTLSGAPYLALIGTASLAPDLSTSVFANGGHPQLGSFRDTDNTFASVGANVVKGWGGVVTGLSFEQTHYFAGSFGKATIVANDTNLFTRYVLVSNGDIRIVPGATMTIRLDEGLAVQRYSYGAGIEIERRLIGRLWAVSSTRIRYSDYAGADAGRRDTRIAIVGGFRYMIGEGVGARLLAGYENRVSNVNRTVDRLSIGASLDFNIDFTRQRSPAGL